MIVRSLGIPNLLGEEDFVSKSTLRESQVDWWARLAPAFTTLYQRRVWRPWGPEGGRGNVMLDKRELLGLAAAPAPYFAPFLVLLLFGPPSPGEDAAWCASFLGQALLIAYGPVLVLGLPAHLLLRRLGRRDLTSYLLAGFGGGLLLGLVIYAANDWLFPIDPQRNPFT